MNQEISHVVLAFFKVSKFSVHGTEEFLYESQVSIASKVRVRVRDTMATHRISIQYKNRWGCSKKTFLNPVTIADMVPKAVSPPCNLKADIHGAKVKLTWSPPTHNHGYVARYIVKGSCHLCNASTHLTTVNSDQTLMFIDDCQSIKANSLTRYRYTVLSEDCNGKLSEGVSDEVIFRQEGCLDWLWGRCHCKQKTA